jgi:ABC-type molybdate transport system substrate-binding protein
VLSPERKPAVLYAEISQRDYPAIQQAGVVLRTAKDQKLAEEFETFLRNESAMGILRRFGFDVAQPNAH